MSMRLAVLGMLGLLIVAAAVPAVVVGQSTGDDCTFPVTETDATDTEVTVEAEPESVVTLNPSAAQTMWEIGAQGKVVGVSDYAHYLEGASNRTDIWAETVVNVEQVIALDPDLVLAPNTIPNDTVATLRDAGLTVFKFESAPSIDFIIEKTRLTGELVGACDAADRRAAELRRDVATVEAAVAGVDRPRVLYTFFGFTATEGTFVHTIIETAGGENVAADLGPPDFPELSEEIVVARDPEWLLLNSDDPTPPESGAYQGTTAVQEGNTVVVNANYISQPAPRIIQPIETLVRAMHPAAYEEANLGDDGEAGPSFRIESASLRAETVELYDSVTITANVTNTGTTGTFTAGVYVGPGLESTVDFTIQADGSETITLQRPANSLGDHVVRINDHRVGTVTVVRDLANRTAVAEPPSNATETPTDRPTHATPTAESTTLTADPTPADDAVETPTTTVSPTPASSATTEVAGGQPGFGLLASLLALVGALGLQAGRR